MLQQLVVLLCLGMFTYILLIVNYETKFFALLLYLKEYLIVILFCLCLNGKLYPNFVEPRSCRNSCWSRSFGSLGQMQRRSCSKYHLILNNDSLYNIDYSFEPKPLLSFNIWNLDSSTSWMHCWGSGNIALPTDIKILIWQRTTIFSRYRFICCNFFGCCRYVNTY